MYKKILLLVIVNLLLWNVIFPQDNIPRQMKYCGIELTFTEGARKKLANYVNKIQESPRYFNEMLKRTDMYMPFIEEAFTDVRIPQDLKYLAIQESALRPDVVSSSQAVGFWQFKAAAAEQFGLKIDEGIDERSHIYKASRAAATYLASANEDFDNWVYALIAYYEGPTGSVSHTNPDYYAASSMAISENLHWYALKAIAHKIAYENAIKAREIPVQFLQPVSSEGEASLEKIAKKNNVSMEDMLSYNRWIRNEKQLPRNESLTIYIPRSGEYYAGHHVDPNKPEVAGPKIYIASAEDHVDKKTSLDALLDQTPMNKNPESDAIRTSYHTESDAPATETDQAPMVKPAKTSNPAYASLQARPVDQLPAASYVDFPLKQDLHYGLEYIQYDGKMMMEEIANRYVIPLPDLLMWNGLIPGMVPQKGAMVYLSRPTRSEFHVVGEGESLPEIADKHFTSVNKLRKFNRMSKHNLRVYIGQKLYLKTKKPKGEQLIILSDRQPQMVVEIPEVNEPTKNQIETPPVIESPEIEFVASDPEEKENEESPEITDMGAVNTRRVEPVINNVPKKENEGVREVKTRWITHKVAAGESLWQISQKYGTKVEIIKMINKLTKDSISEGQSLRILAKEENLVN